MNNQHGILVKFDLDVEPPHFPKVPGDAFK
jgi:hypothetical protein